MKQMMDSFETKKKRKMPKKEINVEKWNKNELKIKNESNER